MAINTYTMINSKTKKRIEISEVLLVDILQTIKTRKPGLYKILFKKYEELEDRAISEKDLIY